MATLTIRQLDDDVYARLKARARRNHRSLEAEARLLLAERSTEIGSLVDTALEFQRRMRDRHGVLPDTTELLRQARDGE